MPIGGTGMTAVSFFPGVVKAAHNRYRPGLICKKREADGLLCADG